MTFKRRKSLEKRVEYIMPFGKYRGVPLDRIKTSYLDWLIGQSLRDPLKAAVEKELESRPDWKSGDFLAEDEFHGDDDDPVWD